MGGGIMERPRFIESQIEKAKDMIKSRDMQFSNLYRQVIENKKEIRRCIKLIEEVKNELNKR